MSSPTYFWTRKAIEKDNGYVQINVFNCQKCGHKEELAFGTPGHSGLCQGCGFDHSGRTPKDYDPYQEINCSFCGMRNAEHSTTLFIEHAREELARALTHIEQAATKAPKNLKRLQLALQMIDLANQILDEKP